MKDKTKAVESKGKNDDMAIERKKPTICTTVSPYIRRKIEYLVNRKEFSSASDLVSQAVSDYIARNFPHLILPAKQD